ncbi:MAG: hypothetical protein ACJAR1_001265 [Rubritalea sp.]|jgi:hypothetical protein
MLLQIIGLERKTVFIAGDAHKKGEARDLLILFAAPKDIHPSSYLTICLPSRPLKSQNFGAPGHAGYSLDLACVVKLADKKSKKKAEPNKENKK